LTEPQTWTLIGGFFAVYLSTFTLFASMQTRTIKAQVDRLGSKIDGVDQRLGSRIDGLDQKFGIKIDSVDQRLGSKIDGLDQKLGGRIDGLDQKIDGKVDSLRNEMNARFDTVDTRLTTIDRDVQALTERVFRTEGT
jgi:tetrahydromethanopterin S-methyltransferase subunit G